MKPEASCLQYMRAAMERYNMVQQDDCVLVAVSGGRDSICLLHALHTLGYDLHIAHFDHLTRDGASTKDALFVQNLARQMDLPFHSTARPIEQEATEAGLSFEAYARRERYAFLTRTARESGCTALATGHHADDVVETTLMRLMRGTTPRGLSGIPPVTERDGVRIIRPLIHCRRDDIDAFIARQGLAYRDDASNQDERFLRNSIRHTLLPLLRKEYNPKVDEAILRLCDTVQTEDDYLRDLAHAFLLQCLQDAITLQREPFTLGPLALQRRALVEWGWSSGLSLSQDRVDCAIDFIAHGETGKRLDLAEGCYLENTRDHTCLHSGSSTQSTAENAVLPIPGEIIHAGKRWVARSLASCPDNLKTYCGPDRQVFDADRLGRHVVLRGRRDGDRIEPIGMDGTRKLKDYFIDAGIPASERGHVTLVESDGIIVWVVGGPVARHAAVTDKTTRWLELEILNASQQ